MKLTNYLKPNLILTDCIATNVEDILSEIVHYIKLQKMISNEKLILEKLIGREKLGSTSIGNFAAVPHAKIKDIKEPLILIAISKKGFIYHQDDKEPVHLIILILSPNNSPIVHLQILAAAASLIKKSKRFIKDIKSSSSPEESIDIIKKYEQLNE